MVARYSTGEKYAAHSEAIARITAVSDELRGTALQLAQDDARAFTTVTDAYRLPKSTADEKAARSAAVARALVGAATPPAKVITVALRLTGLAEELLPLGNRNVITDVAAATEATRAAAATSRVNVEISLAGIKDPVARAELTGAVGRAGAVCSRAERISGAVREEITA